MKSFVRRTTIISAAILGMCISSSALAAVFFTEYVEGSSLNKALEIFNGNASDIDLSAGAYQVRIFSNGSSTASFTIDLTGIVDSGDVLVLANPSADPAILSVAHQTSGALAFNGDDAVGLYQNGVLLDLIGEIGVDPGVEWTDGAIGTQDETLVRKPGVTTGNPLGFADLEALSNEWDGFPIDTFSNLGITAHSPVPVPAAVWLFGSGLIGLIGVARRKSS